MHIRSEQDRKRNKSYTREGYRDIIMNNKWFKLSGLIATAAITSGIIFTSSALAQSPTPTQTPSNGRGMMSQGAGMQGAGMMGGQTNSMVATAAKSLDMTQTDLVAALNGGKTVADVAKDKGVSLDVIVNAFVATRSDWMKTMVTSGRLTQAQADANLAIMKTNITSQLNEKWSPRGNGTGTPGASFVDGDGDGVCDNMGTAAQGSGAGQMGSGRGSMHSQMGGGMRGNR